MPCGLLLGTEAAFTMPDGVDFSFLVFSVSALSGKKAHCLGPAWRTLQHAVSVSSDFSTCTVAVSSVEASVRLSRQATKPSLHHDSF